MTEDWGDAALVDEPTQRGDENIGRAFRWSLVVIGIAAGVVVLFLWLLSAPAEPEVTDVIVRYEPPDTSKRLVSLEAFPDTPFTDITSQAGIDFVHVNRATGEKMMPDVYGGGGAFWDFDGDGDQDILLVNSSGTWPGRAPPAKQAPSVGLYRNNGRGKFENITAGSGLVVRSYGMGVAIGDYNADGRSDAFITALGQNYLFRNDGEGQFTDVTAKAGVAGDPNRWSTCAGFFDYDRDGDLDLFVANYVDWSPKLDRQLDHYPMGVHDYLPPYYFRGTQCYLYRNGGDGKYEDVSHAAGIHVVNPDTRAPMTKALGLCFRDLDEDGWIDVIVANDQVPSFVFHNQRGKSFQETGVKNGLGYDERGQAVAGMGVDAAYLYGDRRLVIPMANIVGGPTAMFTSQEGPFLYLNEVYSTGTAPATLPYTAFGLFVFDYDLDGRLDLFQANGHVVARASARLAGHAYFQPSQLFWNCGKEHKVPLALVPRDKCGPAIYRNIMGRGAAYADIDDDGDLDLLVVQNAGPPLLLRNDQQLGHHWIRLKLIGPGGNHEAIGARIQVRVGDQLLRRQVMPTRSYLSQVELPVTIGLGGDRCQEVKIVWPDGVEQTVENVKMDALTVVRYRAPQP